MKLYARITLRLVPLDSDVKSKEVPPMTRHFGVLIPSTNTTVEIEYTQLLPRWLQAHYARLGKIEDIAFSPSRDDDLSYQSKLLGNAKVEAISLTQTSASVHDDNYDATANACMAAGANAPAFTSAEAIGRAVLALGGKRIALVSPYSDAVMARTKRYFTLRYGLEVIATAAFGATDSYAIGEIEEAQAIQAFDDIDQPNIDVMVVPGGNFPTMQYISKWEQRLGKPVITTNQAVIWGVLQALVVTDPVPGLGALLENPAG
jgi:maleate isomerase